MHFERKGKEDQDVKMAKAMNRLLDIEVYDNDNGNGVLLGV